MSIKDVFSNGLWLIFGSTVSNVVSFVYIFIISQSVQTEVVGVLGAILALQSTLGVLFSLGIPTGIQFFVGKARGKGDLENVNDTFLTNMVSLFLLNTISTVILLASFFLNIGFLGFSSTELLLVASIHILTSLSPIFLALFISLMESKIAAFAQIISSLVKIPVGIIALTIAPDIVSACSGIIFSYLIMDLFLIFHWRRRLWCGEKLKLRWDLFKDVVRAGRPSWVVTVFSVLGESLGVIMIFNFVGEISTGLYYIAFAIASIIYLIPSSILGVLFPFLTGIEEGKKEAALKAIRLGMVITVPITFGLFAYPEIPLAILGSDYISASIILRMLLFGTLLSSIVVGYTSYVYAEQKYRTVFIIGFSTNATRLVLYYPLVILASGLGAAFAHSFGILIGFIVVVFYSYKGELKFKWRVHGKVLLSPLVLVVLLLVFQPHPIIGLPIFFLITLLTYGRMKVLTKKDLNELSGIIFTPKQIQKFMTHFRPIVNFIFGE